MKPGFFGLLLAAALIAGGVGGAIASKHAYLGSLSYTTEDDVRGTEAVANRTAIWVVGFVAVFGLGVVALGYDPLKKTIVRRELKRLDEMKLLSAGTYPDITAALSMEEQQNG